MEGHQGAQDSRADHQRYKTPPLCTTQFRILFIGKHGKLLVLRCGDNVNASDIMSVFDMHASSASSFNCNASGVPWGSHTGYGPKWGGAHGREFADSARGTQPPSQ